jgi:intergrase/recombinase
LSQKTGHSSIVKTARSYLNYCEKHEKLPSYIILKYRSILKLKRSQPDVYVPQDSEVLASYHKIKQNKTLDLIFLVLATSGIRYVECLDFLKNLDGTRFKTCPAHVAYSVAKTRNTKNINNIYLPLFVYKKLKHIDESYPNLRMQFYRKGSLFSVKYLRKWQYNFLIYNNVPESVADFIQGRASRSIGANHYLAKAQQADFWYSKVAHKLEGIFSNTTISKNHKADSRHTVRAKNKKILNYSR